MAKLHKPDLKVIEPYDVSFVQLRSDGNWPETVQKVATAINVQFTESSELLPFVPSRQFSSMLREEKVFLVGPSGSGKSRTIIELLRSSGASYDRIFVINPSNPAGLESGRENITKLSRQFGRGDLVIWDNFPDGLVKRDLESAFGALEIVNATPVQNLYIALKPSYLEAYRGLTTAIPDIYTFEISCDLETMRSLIKAYGKVEQYREVFRFVSANTDRIARILWQKQPLSLTVVDYYKALLDAAAESAIDELTALQMASSWLPAYDYFERQFEVMKNMPARRGDVEFLYVLRFCYEVGFDRTQASLAGLQKGIFGSELAAEPMRELGTWLYLSGQNYAMHDSAKNAVKLTDYSRMKTASYLANNFAELVPKGEGELHALGLFIGKNIEFITSNGDGGQTAIPDQIRSFMKKKAVFERAVGRGVGENFERLDDSLQERILQLVDTEIEFGVGVADSLGERFIELDDSNRNKVFDKIYQGMLFARYFGQSVGRMYSRLPDELRSLVMAHANRNPQFADGLGMGFGYMFAALEPALQAEVMDKAKGNFEISRGVGFGFGLTVGMLPEDDASRIIALADNNSELDTGFGMGMAVSYLALSDRLRRFVLDRVASDCEFAFGVGVYGGYFHKESCPPDLFELLEKNTEVAYGLGLGYGPIFFYLPEKFQSELDQLLKENVKMDDGIGSGTGFVLKHFPPHIQEMFFAKASTKNAFASGLGYGMGYTWRYVGEVLRKRAITLAGSNNDFARGLGVGFGCHLDYLESGYRDQALSLADANSELDRGLGTGAAWAWPYFGDEARSVVSKRMDARTEFALGFGFGLARVVKQFPPAEKERLLVRLSFDPFFSEGFGEGTGQYRWSIYGMQEKQEFLSQSSNSVEIARGLGTGIGLLFPYFEGELGSGTLQAFLKKDPSLRQGIGAGMGRAYRYLPESARLKALGMAEEDVEFASGFGQGIGTVFNYLEEPEKERVKSYLGDNGFSRGLGRGLGLVFPFLTEAAGSSILALATNNAQLAIGLGTGVAVNISYLSGATAGRIFDLAKDNAFLAVGLGEGCGYAFSKLSKPEKDWISPRVGLDSFAFGFGVATGKIRHYYRNNSEFEQAADFAKGHSFTKGFAVGIGSSAARIPQDLLLQALSVEYGDVDFARHFGFGLGHVLSQLDDSKKKEIFAAMKDSEEFLAGLGEGIGHYLPIIGSQLAEETMQSIDSPSFSSGTAMGLAESFRHLDMVEVLGVMEYAVSNPDYGKVLGKGLGEKFASFDQDTQLQIINALHKDSAFSREFAKALPGNMAYMSTQSRERIKELLTKFPHLGAALG